MTGRNIRHILDKSEEDDIFQIKPKQFRRKLKLEKSEDEELWKVKLIKDITNLKHNVIVMVTDDEDNNEDVHFTDMELDEILQFECLINFEA